MVRFRLPVTSGSFDEAPPAGPDALPWERRSELGIERAYGSSLRLFLTRPTEAWRATSEDGGYEDPAFFSFVSVAIGQFFSSLYPVLWITFLLHADPSAIPARLGRLIARTRPWGAIVALVAAPLASAVIATAFLFVIALIFHACLRLVGALSDSTSGYEGTFRAVAYSQASHLALAIPLVGALIALVWSLILAVTGSVRMHRTTPARVAAALSVPVVAVIVILVALRLRG
jgi:hypothetical protein